MTAPDDHRPPAAADRERVALADAAELLGQRGDQPRIVIAPLGQRGERRLVTAVATIVAQARVGVPRARALHRHVGDEVLRLRAPEIDAVALGKPGGVAKVIGVEVGDDHSRHPAAGQDALPQRAHVVEADAGVHDGEAVAVGEQPQVDVIELEGQRHAQPLHARRDDERRAGRGRFIPGKVERHALQCTRSPAGSDPYLTPAAGWTSLIASTFWPPGASKRSPLTVTTRSRCSRIAAFGSTKGLSAISV